MYKKPEPTSKQCPECGVFFTDRVCPNCGWQSKEDKGGTTHYCDECHAATRHFYKGKWLCIDCLTDAYGRDYEYKATPDQVSKFLIEKGSKSPFWQHATEEQKKNALEYYKRNNNERDIQSPVSERVLQDPGSETSGEVS